MPRQVKTRDYNLLLIIGGATKAGIHTDAPKQASRTACRGNKLKMTPAKKILRTFDWTRPALHGDELFEIGVDGDGNIVAAAFIDEEGNALPFNLLSFNEEEMSNIREAMHGD